MITDFLPFSLIDFPGKLSSVVYFAGCNLRCPYCHNPELVYPRDCVDRKKDFFSFLKSRKGLLEGVVLSGGEPTVGGDLLEVVNGIKDLGFSVKLDTNGTNPDVLSRLLSENLVDYVAMDVKCGISRYTDFLGFKGNPEKIIKSIEVLKNSSVDFEFRCTVGSFTKMEDLFEIAQLVKGAKIFVIQQYVKNGKELIPNNFKKLDREELKKKANFLREYVGKLLYRFYED